MQSKKFSRPETAPDIQFKKEDTIKFWLESHHLAPDWNKPLLNLLESIQGTTAFNQVVPLAEDFLTRQPEQDSIRNYLVDAYLNHKRFDDVVRLTKLAAQLNPLDEDHQSRHRHMSMFLVLSKLGQAPVNTLLQELLTPSPDDTLVDAILAKLLRRTLSERTIATQEVVERDPGYELVLAYQRHFTSVLYKDKPAVKTKLKATFNEAVLNETNPLTLLFTVLLCEYLKLVGQKFMGQGVAEKQLLNGFAQRMNDENRDELIEDVLSALLAFKINGKQIKTVFVEMAKKHPKNPMVQYAEFAYRLVNEKRLQVSYRDDMRAQIIRAMFLVSKNPKHQNKITLIEELIVRFELNINDADGFDSGDEW